MTYAETDRHVHYVTIKDHARTALAAGPYTDRREAEAHVEEVRRFVREHERMFSDVYAAAFLAFGTSRLTLKMGETPPAGRLNAVLTA
jgi:hypothetical protein